MRLHQFSIALTMVVSLFACIAARGASPNIESVQAPASAASPAPPKVADPMASFARMVGGEWKMTSQSGTSMYETWHWGPGNHSMRAMTHGENASGEPWRALQVFYWHPGLKQVRTLALNPYAQSVSEGTIAFDGEVAQGESDLHQTGKHRKMAMRWDFDGPDKYHDTLLESAVGDVPPRYQPLASWDRVRSTPGHLTPIAALPAENPPRPSDRMSPLLPLIGRVWDATVKASDWRERGGDAVHIETTFEWVPYIDAIYARTFALRGYGEPTHVFDAYFYHHTGTNTLRCLALSDWGGQRAVYEGDITVIEGGGSPSLQFDLKGYEGDRAVSRSVHIDFEQNGDLHQRAWAVAEDNASERTLVLDVRHSASVMSKGIWYVFQDANDNYWFGSDGKGVYRYDGKTLTQFTTRDGLSHDQVRGIQQHAPTGDILITTIAGVSKFDGNRFVTLPATELKPDAPPHEGWSLNADDVWMTGSGGPRRYDGKTLYQLKFPRSPHADEWYAKHGDFRWNPYDVWTVYKDRRGHIWFGAGGMGICRFDGDSLDWLFESHLTEVEGGGWFGFRSIIEDKDGAFWFCNTQYRYDIQPHGVAGQEVGKIKYTCEKGIDLSGSATTDKFLYFQSITADEDGDLWMTPYAGGVWKYDGKNVTHFPMKHGDSPDDEVTMFTISKDNHGGLWVGTHEHGAYKFNGKSFEKFAPTGAPQPRVTETARRDPYFTPTEAKTTATMPRVIIRNMREDRAGNIWFATYGGPIRYDGKNFTNFADEVGLAKTRVFSLLEDRSGAMWFGSITGGATRYEGKSFTKFTTMDGLASDDVPWIFEDRDGIIWFGTEGGVSRYDGKSFTNFTTKDGLISNSVYAIAQDASGRLWFGTQGGICSYDGKAFSNLADTVGRSFANIRAIAIDQSDNIWFGGQQGAFRYDGKTLTSFNSRNGLLDDFVGSMIVDRAGNVWLGHPGRDPSVGGASRYDGKAFKHFTQKDGMGSTNVYCMLEDKAGRIWFGSVDAGACRYDGVGFTLFSATDSKKWSPTNSNSK